MLYYTNSLKTKYIDPIEIHYVDVKRKSNKTESKKTNQRSLTIHYGRNFVSEEFSKSPFPLFSRRFLALLLFLYNYKLFLITHSHPA